MKLVIVESPTKARKLSGYLGSEYAVQASVGHVRDLPKSTLGIAIDRDFEPEYVISDDKKKVVTQLKKLADDADQIILATDPDREGEAIAWHVQELLSVKKKQSTTKDAERFVRATFHEITKSAVLAAMEHPQTLNLALVDAQQARRVVDRLVGYKLSPVLWKKIRRGLSAGRVQSVALRLIVEREREIAAFVPEEFWEIDVLMSTDSTRSQRDPAAHSAHTKENTKGNREFVDLAPDMFVGRVIEINGKKYAPHREDEVSDVVAHHQRAQYQIQSVDKKERNRASFPPFTTSTLQQGAANKLGFTSKQTMTLAQQLYEEGLITYHRTDSVHLSDQAVSAIRDYIGQVYGDAYVPKAARHFSTKSKNAQEAHEAIRVTDVRTTDVVGRGARIAAQHQRLYDLIWRRTVASQMESAVYDQTTILTAASSESLTSLLRTTGSTLRFDGWMKLFPNQGDVILPVVQTGQKVAQVDVLAAQKFTQPPARYNDASLVKTLEEKGIGRPSTYASIISVIVDRGYVERTDKRFFATAVGMTVCDFLVEHFGHIMDYDFTAEMEEDLDRIARGEKEWHTVVGAFYTPLEKKIDEVAQEADRVQIPVEETGEQCPDCDAGKIVIRTGRFGKFKSCSRFPECKYTQNIVDVVEGVRCPLCQEGDVVAKNSRWGKPFYGCARYPECSWASWSKPNVGDRVTPEQWAVMQAERQEKAAARKAAWAAKNGGVEKKIGPKATKGTAAKKVSKKKVATKKVGKKTSAPKKKA